MRKSDHRARRCLVAFLLLCCFDASAQWEPEFTANLGAGYGSIALSQSIISGTRRLGTDAQGSRGSPAPALSPGSPRNADTLTYVPDALLSAQVRESTIDALSQQNPALRQQLEQAFANNAVLRSFDSFMSGRGYSSRNVADAKTALLVVSWEIATGANASDAQIQGTDRQVRSVFLHSPQLSSMSNAQRQEMAERIAYQVVISASAKNEYVRNADQAHLAQLRQSAITLMQQQGIDLARLRLTEQGFVKSS